MIEAHYLISKNMKTKIPLKMPNKLRKFVELKTKNVKLTKDEMEINKKNYLKKLNVKAADEFLDHTELYIKELKRAYDNLKKN